MHNIVIRLKYKIINDQKRYVVNLYWGQTQRLTYYVDASITRKAIIERLLYMLNDEELVRRYDLRQQQH